jgi:BirA family biotin operon repressor/biotin-[acetyl-CoA-carboxylase] ligase
VALAGRDAALDVAGVSCGLKWPNDLMVGDAYDSKLAGVLAETDGAGAVAVGIGMNVAWSPAGAARLGEGISREGVLASLLVSLDRWLGEGWPAIAHAYREACVTIGRPVRVDLVAGDSLVGVAVDVDDEGRLVLESDGALRVIEVGDVVHLR